MNRRLKALLLLALCGILLGLSPGTRLYSADDGSADSYDDNDIEGASIQFILVHVEREILEELMDESNVVTLDSIPLERIGQSILAEDGAAIVSQTKLTVIDEHEAEMTVTENERRKTKNADEAMGEKSQREAEVFVLIEPEIHDGKTLIAEFTYKRSVVEEGFHTGEEMEEEEGIEQKFEISSGVVLHAGQACIAGANLNGDMATLLIVKADLK